MAQELQMKTKLSLFRNKSNTNVQYKLRFQSVSNGRYKTLEQSVLSSDGSIYSSLRASGIDASKAQKVSRRINRKLTNYNITGFGIGENTSFVLVICDELIAAFSTDKTEVYIARFDAFDINGKWKESDTKYDDEAFVLNKDGQLVTTGSIENVIAVNPTESIDEIGIKKDECIIKLEKKIAEMAEEMKNMKSELFQSRLSESRKDKEITRLNEENTSLNNANHQENTVEALKAVETKDIISCDIEEVDTDRTELVEMIDYAKKYVANYHVAPIIAYKKLATIIPSLDRKIDQLVERGVSNEDICIQLRSGTRDKVQSWIKNPILKKAA